MEEHFSNIGLLPPLAASPPNRRMRVLHVDGNRDDQMLCQEATRDAGIPFDWDVVNSGESAIAYFQSASALPDLILLDLHLPDGSGMTLLKYLRAHPPLANLPVVIVGGSPRVLLSEALREGAALAFEKPANFNELVEIMKIIHQRMNQLRSLSNSPKESN